MPSIITTTPNTLVRISPKDPHQLQYSDLKGIVKLAHAHNMLLNILLDTGIFGIAALCFALYLVIRKLRFVGAAAELRPYMCLAAAAVTATLLHGMTDFPAFGVSTALLLTMIMSSTGLFINK